jgi:uncharacterized protein
MTLPSTSKLISRRSISKAFGMLALSALLTLSFASPSFAQSLDDLRATGKIGEAFDGLARSRDASFNAMVQDINAKRKEIYAQRAQQQGTTPAQVGAVYADQIIAKAPSGTWLLLQDGSWRQK